MSPPEKIWNFYDVNGAVVLRVSVANRGPNFHYAAQLRRDGRRLLDGGSGPRHRRKLLRNYERGGANSDGTVFRISPSGVLTTIYSFCSKSGCSDGANPVAALIQATDGNLYGTTQSGTVFKITLSGTLTTLGGTGGQDPLAALIQGKDGNFYGTTDRGGTNTCTLRPGYRVSCGTVFKIIPSGTVTTLVSFNAASGFAPAAPLIQATDGNFYGTTNRGGANYPGFGTVFKVTPTGTLTVLHSFDGTDGELCLAGLVQGTDGNFYGTTSFGGANANFGGTVFKITPTGTLTTLHTFDGTDGELPYSTLVEGANGDLYGTTEFGANSACSEGCGTVFSLSVGLAP
ncbi:MAG: choice-of-anchor tandem repeat GloVer-containing protein [Terriglobales bacterium]|jgi:uncharacterized repeat protein (TIGR03803 family)